MNDSTIPKFLVIVGGIAFGTAAIFIKLCDFTPDAIAFFRFFIAGLILAPLGLNLKDILKTMLPGFLLVLHMLLFIESLYYTTVNDSTVLVSTTPIFILIISLLTRKKVPLTDIVFISIALGGIVLLNYPFVIKYILGNVLAILSALMMAFYTLALRRYNYKNPLELTSSIYLSASIFLAPVVIITGIGNINLRSIEAISGLIFIPTIVGHGSYIYISNKLRPQIVSLMEILEPVVATILAIPIFEQIPTIYQIIGSIIVLASLAYLLYYS